MLKSSFQNITFLLVEHMLILLSVLIATAIRFSLYGNVALMHSYEFLEAKAILIALVCQISLYYNDFYDFRITNSLQEALTRLIQSLGISSIILAFIYFLFPDLVIGRSIFIVTIFLIIIILLAWRKLYWKILSSPILNEKVLIIGSGKTARMIAHEIFANPQHSFTIIGFLSSDKKKVGKSIINPKVLGTYEDLEHTVKEKKINRIITAMNDRRGALPVNNLINCRFDGVAIEEAASFYEKITGKILVENLYPSWLIFSKGFNKIEFFNKVRRVASIFLSIIGIFFSFPLIILTSIAIKSTSKGPVFLKQERVGEKGEIFTLLKFRTMFIDAEDSSGPVWTSDDDKRITCIGNILRKYRIDEIPQLFNVLKGDMNIVGPRPERHFFVEKLNKEIPYYMQRLTVKPGITGWAQIKYQYGNTIEDSLEKLQYDLYYIKNCSLLLDLTIIFETIKVVILKRGAI